MQVGGRQWVTNSTKDDVKRKHEPVATWYDYSQHHFIALSRRPIGAVPQTLSELVEYQIFPLSFSTEATSRPRTNSDDDVCEKLVLKFRLPPTLAVEKHHDSDRDDVTELARRIPLDVKCSLDQRFIAMQFTSTLIRIVPIDITCGNSSDSSSVTSQNNANAKHWTIDYSCGHGEPMSSAPYLLPLSTSSSNNKDTTILPGGIHWSDHGGNSQDLIVATTKAVLCYKVSSKRNQMATTYTFPQSPPACHVWFDSTTRTLVVGAIGAAADCTNSPKKTSREKKTPGTATLQLHSYLLRFPTNSKSKRLPRLEVPPPRKLPPYALGLSRLSQPSPTTTTTTDSTSKTIITPDAVRLSNIYGDAYILELERGCNAEGVKLQLHCINPSLTTITPFKTYTFENFHPIAEDLKCAVCSVVDNLLFVTFRQKGKSFFLDIADTDNAYFSESIVEQPVMADLFQGNSQVSFLPPSHFYVANETSGHAFPLSLDIPRLAETLPWIPSIVPFFLRRDGTHHPTHRIAMTKLAELLSSQYITRAERRRTMDFVAQMYATHATTKGITWDWGASLGLMYQCALLPPDAAFCHHSIDNVVLGIAARKSPPPKHNKQSRASLLYQTEILSDILLPNASEAIQRSGKGAIERIPQVLDFAIGLLGSLDRHGCLSCPALECLVASILWHLGYETELLQFLESRCFVFPSRMGKRKDSIIPSNVMDVATVMLTRLLLALSEEVQFGILQQVQHLHSSNADWRYKNDPSSIRIRKAIKSWSRKVILARVANVPVKALYLLDQGWVQYSINLCSCCGGNDDDDDNDFVIKPKGDRHLTMAASIHKLQMGDSMTELFLTSGIYYCKERKNRDATTVFRMLWYLHALLSRHDIDCNFTKCLWDGRNNNKDFWIYKSGSVSDYHASKIIPKEPEVHFRRRSPSWASLVEVQGRKPQGMVTMDGISEAVLEELMILLLTHGADLDSIRKLHTMFGLLNVDSKVAC